MNDKKLRGPATQMIDLSGSTLVPGFVDAHGHIFLGGLQALTANLLAPPDGATGDRLDQVQVGPGPAAGSQAEGEMLWIGITRTAPGGRKP